VNRPVEQRAEFVVRAPDEVEARRLAEAIVADEDRDAMWSDHDRDHDEVVATRILSVEPAAADTKQAEHE
jgi:hypothetical protein